MARRAGRQRFHGALDLAPCMAALTFRPALPKRRPGTAQLRDELGQVQIEDARATPLAIPARYPQAPATCASELDERMDLLGFIKSMALLAFVAAGGLTIVLFVLFVLFVLIAFVIAAGSRLVVWLSWRRSQVTND